MVTAPVQLDLFAEPIRARDLEAWVARFERALWIAPYDCGLGPEGTVVSGWVCPGCGKVEVNEFLLNINHGYDPSIPERMAGCIEVFGATCTRLRLLASQERAAAAKAARAGAA